MPTELSNLLSKIPEAREESESYDDFDYSMIGREILEYCLPEHAIDVPLIVEDRESTGKWILRINKDLAFYYDGEALVEIQVGLGRIAFTCCDGGFLRVYSIDITCLTWTDKLQSTWYRCRGFYLRINFRKDYETIKIFRLGQ